MSRFFLRRLRGVTGRALPVPVTLPDRRVRLERSFSL